MERQYMLVLKLGKLGHRESSAGIGACTSLTLDFDAGTKVVEGRRKEMTPQNSYLFFHVHSVARTLLQTMYPHIHIL